MAPSSEISGAKVAEAENSPAPAGGHNGDNKNKGDDDKQGGNSSGGGASGEGGAVFLELEARLQNLRR